MMMWGKTIGPILIIGWGWHQLAQLSLMKTLFLPPLELSARLMTHLQPLSLPIDLGSCHSRLMAFPFDAASADTITALLNFEYAQEKCTEMISAAANFGICRFCICVASVQLFVFRWRSFNFVHVIWKISLLFVHDCHTARGEIK